LDQKTKNKKFAGEMIVELGTFQTSLEDLAKDTRLPREVIDTLETFLEELEKQRQKEIKIISDELPVNKAF